ncbi:MAG TPA: MFS transporter, partial [Ktedonobacterales bacterium]
NFNVLLPLEATQGLHAGPALFGLLTSSLGVGALLGALLLARRRGPPTNQLLVGMALTFGVLETGIALTRSVPAAMVLFAATGFFMSSFSAAANTRVQLASPPELRGRVMSVYMMVFAGTTPIGNLLTSGIAGSAGVAMSFVVSGVPCVLAALVSAWLWRAPRRVARRARVAQPAVAATAPALPEATHPARRSLPSRQPRPAPGNPAPQPRAAMEPR